eukprot:CAMPEP_0175044086 /NCGR_PEP_ID=MMETSP0052_2-20121109/3590_1 /TAXON_ID=51329 ORGANISM="Polytomella parva, Strain SAG 63-3" /NCGR_SAMPLE_ID=MMETSP0052_2 /ASSEMBLY_ACC=CAM_ASM_000194 /LENGTH=97 /DNA_ID=CAMNT_0016307303 /DNA_START=58 /DNA_END=347 /DNA_ORIENTATION=+
MTNNIPSHVANQMPGSGSNAAVQSSVSRSGTIRGSGTSGSGAFGSVLGSLNGGLGFGGGNGMMMSNTTYVNNNNNNNNNNLSNPGNSGSALNPGTRT